MGFVDVSFFGHELYSFIFIKSHVFTLGIMKGTLRAKESAKVIFVHYRNTAEQGE